MRAVALTALALAAAAGPASVPALPTVITWDGGGADNNWTTPSNWSTNTIPTQFDSVLFDGTSLKDCILPAQFQVIDFTIEAGYTGIIESSPGDTHGLISGNFYQAGGELTELPVGDLYVYLFGDLQFSGGTMSARRLYLEGSGQQVSFDARGAYIQRLSNFVDSPGDFSLNGMFNILNLNVTDGTEAQVLPGTESEPGYVAQIGRLLCRGTVHFDWDPVRSCEVGAFEVWGEFMILGGNVVIGDSDGVNGSYSENYGMIRLGEGVSSLSLEGMPTLVNGGTVIQEVPISGAWGAFASYGEYEMHAGLTVWPEGYFQQSGMMNIHPAATLTALGTETYWNLGQIHEEGVILKEAAAIGLINGAGGGIFQFSFGDDLRVLLIDADENLDGDMIDPTWISVVNLDGGDFEFVELLETGVATGQFRNDAALLPTVSGPAGILNGVLEGQPGDTIGLFYADDEDPADEISRMITSIVPPTATPTVTPSPNPTPSPNATATPTRTPTPTPDLTIPSPTVTATATASAPPTATPAPTATPDCGSSGTSVLTSTGAQDGALWDNPDAQGNGTNPGGNNTISSGSGIRIGEAEASMSYLDFAYKSVLSFDTSAIPAGAVILDATLTLHPGPTVGSPGTQGFGARYVEIRRGHFGASADFEFPGSPAPGNTDWSAPADAGGPLTTPLNPTGQVTDLGALVAWINQAGGPDGGLTQLRLRHENLLYNTGGLHYWTFDSGEGSNPPVLTVDWCLPNAMPTPTATPPPAATATATPAATTTATATVTAPPCCPGDADNSGGNVNANDFLAVQANFGASNGVGGLGDADCSGGAVNANDFLAVQANFGASCG